MRSWRSPGSRPGGGRPYATHMRDEGERLGEALEEAIEIGRRSGARVQVSHCKAFGPENRGKSALLLDTLHRARAEGIDVRGRSIPVHRELDVPGHAAPVGGVRGRRRGAQVRDVPTRRRSVGS